MAAKDSSYNLIVNSKQGKRLIDIVDLKWEGIVLPEEDIETLESVPGPVDSLGTLDDDEPFLDEDSPSPDKFGWTDLWLDHFSSSSSSSSFSSSISNS